MTSSAPTFTIFLTIGGCGNHLIKDFLKSLDVTFVPAQMADFWACWVQAHHHPDQPTISDWFPQSNALEAVKGYYQRFGAEVPADPLNMEAAAAAFAKGLEGFGHSRLFTHHLFPFLVAYPSLRTVGGHDVPWPIEYARESMHALERGLDLAGWQRHYVSLVRHPIDTFLSNNERFGSAIERSALLQQVRDFADSIQSYRSLPPEQSILCRYEDLCRKDETSIRRMLDILGLRDLPLSQCRLDILHEGEIAKYQGYGVAEVRELARELAQPLALLDYPVRIPRGVEGLRLALKRARKRWQSEKASFDKIFAGDFTPAAAVLRHRRSVMIKLYWQINMLIPAKRTHYLEFYRQETGDEMPTPRLERPFRRLLGLRVVE